MSNLVDFLKKKQDQASNKNASNGETNEKTALSFEEIAKRNLENSERIKREREKANKNVLRSYRIK